MIEKDEALLSLAGNVTVYVFKLWTITFAYLLFLNLLYLYSGFIQYYGPVELVRNTAGIFLLLCSISAGLGFLSGILAAILYLAWRKKSVGIYVVTLNNVLTVVLGLFVVGVLGVAWVRVVSGKPSFLFRLTISEYVIPLAIVFGLCAFWIVKRVNADLTKKVPLIFRPVFVFVCLCIMIVTYGFIQGKVEISRFDRPRYVVEPQLESSERPNIILITIDRLSAKNTSVYGYSRKTTPYLEKLGRRSYVFQNAYAAYNGTIPSVMSILSSTYALSHKVYVNTSPYPSESVQEVNLAQILKKNGYQTAALTQVGTAPSLFFLQKDWDYPPLLGLGEAFHWLQSKILNRFQIDSLLWIVYLKTTYYSRINNIIGPLKRWAEGWIGHAGSAFQEEDALFSKAIDLLKNMRRPFFLWIHYGGVRPPTTDFFPVFGSYSVEMQPIVGRLRSAYDVTIIDVDRKLRGFMDELQRMGHDEDSIIVVSADHGFSFEKGYYGYGNYGLNESIVRIPLIIHLPRQQVGKQVQGNAGHVDITPTLLGLVGLKIPSNMEGRNLMNMMETGDVGEGPVFSMAFPRSSPRRKIADGAIAIRYGQYKLICNIGNQEKVLYNLAIDPNEERNVADVEPDITKKLMVFIHNAIDRTEPLAKLRDER